MTLFSFSYLRISLAWFIMLNVQRLLDLINMLDLLDLLDFICASYCELLPIQYGPYKRPRRTSIMSPFFCCFSCCWKLMLLYFGNFELVIGFNFIVSFVYSYRLQWRCWSQTSSKLWLPFHYQSSSKEFLHMFSSSCITLARLFLSVGYSKAFIFPCLSRWLHQKSISNRFLFWILRLTRSFLDSWQHRISIFWMSKVVWV